MNETPEPRKCPICGYNYGYPNKTDKEYKEMERIVHEEWK